MRDPKRQVVITGAGVCCNMGDDLDSIATELRRGHSPGFERYAEAEQLGTRCQLLGLYHGDITNEALGIPKAEGRFHGSRAADGAQSGARSDRRGRT